MKSVEDIRKQITILVELEGYLGDGVLVAVQATTNILLRQISGQPVNIDGVISIYHVPRDYIDMIYRAFEWAVGEYRETPGDIFSKYIDPDFVKAVNEAAPPVAS